MGEPFAVSKCQEPGCKDAVETVGTWSSRLCLKHRRARFGWERGDYEAEARRMLEDAQVRGLQAIEEFESPPIRDTSLRLAEIAVASAAVYARLARESDEVFAPGQPLQPFPGYSRKPPT